MLLLQRAGPTHQARLEAARSAGCSHPAKVQGHKVFLSHLMARGRMSLMAAVVEATAYLAPATLTMGLVVSACAGRGITTAATTTAQHTRRASTLPRHWAGRIMPRSKPLPAKPTRRKEWGALSDGSRQGLRRY